MRCRLFLLMMLAMLAACTSIGDRDNPTDPVAANYNPAMVYVDPSSSKIKYIFHILFHKVASFLLLLPLKIAENIQEQLKHLECLYYLELFHCNQLSHS